MKFQFTWLAWMAQPWYYFSPVIKGGTMFFADLNFKIVNSIAYSY
jgi:hypothetical protein